MSAPPKAAPVSARRPWRWNWAEIPKQVVMLFAAFVILLPGYFLVITPFKSLVNYSVSKLGFPNPIVIDNFITALRGGRFFQWFGNSVIMAVAAVALSTVVSA